MLLLLRAHKIVHTRAYRCILMGHARSYTSNACACSCIYTCGWPPCTTVQVMGEDAEEVERTCCRRRSLRTCRRHVCRPVAAGVHECVRVRACTAVRSLHNCSAAGALDCVPAAGVRDCACQARKRASAYAHTR
eukprot:5197728-Pleurochrysis_carterae.AAC.1